MSFFKEAISRHLDASSRVGGDHWTRQNRTDINRIDNAVDYIQQGSQGVVEGLVRRLDALEQQVRQNTERLEQTALLTESLMELIVAREWASSEEVAAFITKVEAEWEEEARRGGEPSRKPPPQHRKSTPTVTCSSCGDEVPKHETFVSELGTVCEACHL